MKYIIFVLLLVISSNSIGQESSDNSKILKEFYTDLCCDNIAPEKIASKYIQYLNKREYKKAVNMMIDFRKLATEEKGHFFLLKKDILENNFSISPYSSFDDDDKIKFNNIAEEKRNNVYKVNPRSTIPQYILFENNKIVSFFGFQKAGYDEYYFIGFQ